MLGPTKPPPRIGAPARIRHFGGGAMEDVVVVEIHDDGRRIVVADAEGARHVFTLRRATATFVLERAQTSPRLLL